MFGSMGLLVVLGWFCLSFVCFVIRLVAVHALHIPVSSMNKKIRRTLTGIEVETKDEHSDRTNASFFDIEDSVPFVSTCVSIDDRP